MVMIDAQTVRGGRAGPTFHSAGGRGGRTVGTKRSILIEILGLPLAVRVDPAKPHDVRVGRELIADHLAELPDVRAIVADHGYRGLANLAARRHLSLDIKAPAKGTSGFIPLAPPLQGRACIRSSGALAASVAVLRRHRGQRGGVARGRVRGVSVRAAAGGAFLITRVRPCRAAASRERLRRTR
jgi:Transposase DDE domain